MILSWAQDLLVKDKEEIFIHERILPNKFLSWLFSVVHKNKITDIATCLKIFRIKILENVNLENQDFSIEVELVSKLLKIQIIIVKFQFLTQAELIVKEKNKIY